MPQKKETIKEGIKLKELIFVYLNIILMMACLTFQHCDMTKRSTKRFDSIDKKLEEMEKKVADKLFYVHIVGILKRKNRNMETLNILQQHNIAVKTIETFSDKALKFNDTSIKVIDDENIEIKISGRSKENFFTLTYHKMSNGFYNTVMETSNEKVSNFLYSFNLSEFTRGIGSELDKAVAV